MFYEDYAASIVCSSGIKAYVSDNPSCEASCVLLLAMYANGNYGTGSATSAEYSLDGRPVTIRPTAGKLRLSFTEEL